MQTPVDQRTNAPGFWGFISRHPLPVAAVVALIAYSLAVMIRWPCILDGYGGDVTYTPLRCYSDIPALYELRGLADNLGFYADVRVDVLNLKYPVVSELVAYLAALTASWADQGLLFFYAWHLLLFGILFAVAVVFTGLTALPRRWDAVLVAVSPAMLLSITINWDIVTVTLVAIWLFLWSRRLVILAGVALALAISAKFYPIIFLGPLFLLCLRSSTLRSYWRMLAATAITWAVVNVPVMVSNFAGWSSFYLWSRERGEDLGSVWLAGFILGINVPGETLNWLGVVVFAGLCAGIAALIWFAPRQPRIAPVLFLTLAAFLATNKVFSPQFVMWLVPLAVLALPRLIPLLIWQSAEVLYFFFVWWYIYVGRPDEGTDARLYAVVIVIRVATLAWFCYQLVRITLDPQKGRCTCDQRRSCWRGTGGSTQRSGVLICPPTPQAT